MVNEKEKEKERETAFHKDVLISSKNEWGILQVMRTLVKEQDEFFDYNQTLNYLLERGIKEFLKDTEM